MNYHVAQWYAYQAGLVNSGFPMRDSIFKDILLMKYMENLK
jgi:hypothetical protein